MHLTSFLPRDSMQNKERHFCFVYFGNRMQIPHFQSLKFHLVEGCCDVEGTSIVQYVRVSLNPSNGRRIGSIPRIIEQYNGLAGSSAVINPVVFFPQTIQEPIKCFKTTDPVSANPILKRIADEQKKEGGTFWRWTVSSRNNELPPEPRAAGGLQVRRQFITSIHDILREMQLPESIVSVQRVYDELSEPYFREFNVPMGEGTGCIPLEHRDFVVSEIKRLFEEELNYIEQPSVATNINRLPLRARTLVDDAGWMGDILLSGDRIDEMAGGAIVRAIRAENVLMRRHLVRTEQRANHDRLDRRGVGHSLRDFLVYYALRWNDEGLASVSKSIQDLHSGWTPPLESLLSFQGLIAGVNLGPTLTVDGSVLNVPSVDRLVKLLCNEGLISHVTSSNHQQAAVLKRMVVRERTTPVSAITKFFKQMLDGWAEKDTVEVTAFDVVRVLNGGDVGVYKRSCVSQFMRPFLFDGSVEGYTWREGAIHHEKYVVHVQLVAQSLDQS